MKPVEVEIMRLPHGEGLPLPAYATEHSAGMDLRAAVQDMVVLAPGARCLVPTGFCIALPEGWEAQVRPRSGLALKHGVTLANSPGTIDADYRGEVGVILINLGDTPFHIQRGDRIAQMLISPVARVEWQVTESLLQTGRGAGGFGSSGKH